MKSFLNKAKDIFASSDVHANTWNALRNVLDVAFKPFNYIIAKLPNVISLPLCGFIFGFVALPALFPCYVYGVVKSLINRDEV